MSNDIIQLTQRMSSSTNIIMTMNPDVDFRSRLEHRGHTVEVWGTKDSNLTTDQGFDEAKERLKASRAQYFWCTPPAPSVPRKTGSRELGDKLNNNERKHAARDRKIWDHTAIRFMSHQLFGGNFYLDALGSDPRWNIIYSRFTRELLGTTEAVLD